MEYGNEKFPNRKIEQKNMNNREYVMEDIIKHLK